jgi:uncharacterized membrane protein YphA (DoxX/SURF4 family)
VTPLAWLAHVTYVTPDSGPDLSFADLLRRVAEHPAEVLLFLLGAVAIAAALLVDLRWRPLRSLREALGARAEAYLELTPWMLRLSLGLPLLGAGVLRYAFAPDVTIAGFPYLALTALGFLLLLGLVSRPAAAGVLVLAALATGIQPHLVEIIELPALAAAIILTGGGVPALDDLLAAAARSRRTPTAGRERSPQSLLADVSVPRDLLALLVRSGLGASFLAAGVTEKLLDPGRASLAVARYDLTAVMPVSEWSWILGVGLVESALGLSLLMGAWTRPAAVLGFGVLSATLFALPDDPVLAHVALFGASSILVVTGSGRWALDPLLSRLRERAARSGSDAGAADARDLQGSPTAAP